MISAAASSASAILPIASSRNPTPPGCPWPIKQGAVARGKVACACVAPNVNFRNDGFSSSSSRYDDRSSVAEGLGVAPMPEDDLDVLIECRELFGWCCAGSSPAVGSSYNSTYNTNRAQGSREIRLMCCYRSKEHRGSRGNSEYCYYLRLY
ncbi:hypothetical protein MLD38_035833 [Melastoma candidum]|uniref:Uncharacterized protein n=2 Tax=Melastoma candidum TaxID=119954 RepID=A0ACB9LI30_9MYRT|nr:hypothetical protein MLD38_035813 [Melastoma candidum]KAI4310888.1 hypothetical protein MLD38_035833 [Melastoma candidum]